MDIATAKRHAFDLKNRFQIKFKEYKDKRKSEHYGKDPSAYKKREKFFCFEQKPVEIADFTKEEKKNC